VETGVFFGILFSVSVVGSFFSSSTDEGGVVRAQVEPPLLDFPHGLNFCARINNPAQAITTSTEEVELPFFWVSMKGY